MYYNDSVPRAAFISRHLDRLSIEYQRMQSASMTLNADERERSGIS